MIGCADVKGGTAESILDLAEHKPSTPASESYVSQHNQQTSKAPPPHSSTAPAKSYPSPARSTATQQQPPGSDNTSPSSPPSATTDNAVSVEVGTAGTSLPANNADSQHASPLAASNHASATDRMAEASSERPTTASQGTASGSRPTFLLMLQSKMEQRRQQRRESQSASESSLSSVHPAGVSSAEKAEGSVTSGAIDESSLVASHHLPCCRFTFTCFTVSLLDMLKIQVVHPDTKPLTSSCFDIELFL